MATDSVKRLCLCEPGKTTCNTPASGPVALLHEGYSKRVALLLDACLMPELVNTIAAG